MARKIRYDFPLERFCPCSFISGVKANRFSIVLVTAPDLKTARRLARLALEAKLVACANIVPKLESHYWWQGKIERSAEVLIIFKTAAARLNAFEQLIVANHPYDTPEFVAWPLNVGTKKYLEWLAASTEG